MIYSDSQIIITGGEDFRMSTPTIQKSLVYSIPTREFQYADEDVPLVSAALRNSNKEFVQLLFAHKYKDDPSKSCRPGIAV